MIGFIRFILVFYGIAVKLTTGAYEVGDEHALRTAKKNEILKYMNLKADPCNDFFDFACGKWSQYQSTISVGKEDDLITVESQMEERINKDLQLLLNENINKHDTPSTRKVKHFYKSCEVAERFSTDFLLDFITRHGGIPSLSTTNWRANYDWVETIAKLRASYGMDILIGLEVNSNPHNAYGKSIFIGEPKETLIPVELCSAVGTELIDVKHDIYKDIEKAVFNDMKKWFSMGNNEANIFAGDVVRFEFELCKKMRLEQSLTSNKETEPEEEREREREVRGRTGKNRLNQNNRYAQQTPLISLPQLTQQYEGNINFKQFVDVSFDTAINDQVYLRSEQYFEHLIRTIKIFTKPTLANYIMYRALLVLNFPSDDDNLNTHRKHCVKLLQRYFPKVIGEMYNRRNQRMPVKNDVDNLYKDINTVFNEALNSDWITENSKRTIRQKVAKTKVKYPLYQNIDLSNLHIERLDYWRKLEEIIKFHAKEQQSPLYDTNLINEYDVEADDIAIKYIPNQDDILVSWGFLQTPLYHYVYGKSLKYSVLGQRLARELISAQDEQAWQLDTMSAMVWDSFTLNGFRNRSECFRQQYSNYLHNDPDEFQNALKLREIIADSDGLSLAFNTYLNWLSKMDPESRGPLMRETLPDLNYSNTQLFFINFAQARCAAAYVAEQPSEMFPFDQQTEERYDVNGPLSNFIEFSREFGCAAGTPMNPGEKCVVYDFKV
ncbi:membrane metallo-endopeptidase-like 1 [Teleopsis dalmanni]|uniref:membrane metallo-endopeptidase-like 1 n=1 Tax=Teleopsis dalmanni TaxID=139649 RepID=UPI0018CDE44E|nr:membrane metallo-endopeptidase-like 1 [Teleopsis dalmanni]